MNKLEKLLEPDLQNKDHSYRGYKLAEKNDHNITH